MKVSKRSGTRVNPEEGTHIALLTQIIDWGTVTDQYGDKRKIEFVFELPEQRHVFNDEDGEVPLIVTRKFGATLGRGSEMKKCIEGMLGHKIDDEIDEDGNYELEPLLGTVCQLSLTLETKDGYTNPVIMSYMPLAKNDKRKFKPEGPTFVFDLDNFDQEIFDSIVDWKQQKIAESPEFKALEDARPPQKQQAPPPPQQNKGKAAPAPQAGKTSGKNLFNKGKGKK